MKRKKNKAQHPKELLHIEKLNRHTFEEDFKETEKKSRYIEENFFMYTVLTQYGFKEPREDNLYEKILGLNSVSKLSKLRQLPQMWNAGLISAVHTRLGHSLEVATKLQELVYRLKTEEQRLAIIAGTTHDIGTVVGGPLVEKGLGLNDELLFDKTLEIYNEKDDASSLCEENGVELNEVRKCIHGESNTLTGFLLNSKNILDVDEYAYVGLDERFAASVDILKNPVDFPDPFKYLEIIEERPVFKNKLELKKFLLHMAFMYKYCYFGKEERKLEAFFTEPIKRLYEEGEITIESLLKPEDILKKYGYKYNMADDCLFEKAIKESPVEIRKKLLKNGNLINFPCEKIKEYGIWEGNKGEEIKDYINKSGYSGYCVVKEFHIPDHSQGDSLVLDDGEVRKLKESDPNFVKRIKESYQDLTGVYGLVGDKELERIFARI